MASTNSLTARLDELRSRNASRPYTDLGPCKSTSSFRYSGSFMSNPAKLNVETPPLHRRFTTDFSKAYPYMQANRQHFLSNENDVSEAILRKTQLLEKKKHDYDIIAEQRRQYQAQAHLHGQQEAREKQEIEQMTRELEQIGLTSGYQTEPTTPPEIRDTSLISLARTNRYSASSFTSPTSVARNSRADSQVASPTSDASGTYPTLTNTEGLPSKSVPGSRRGSRDRIMAFASDTNANFRPNTSSMNRYSMPVTGTNSHHRAADSRASAHNSMRHLNTTSFLLDEEDKSQEPLTSPDVSLYLQMSEDNFPVLIRQSDQPGTLSASSAALDLATSEVHKLDDLASSGNYGSRSRLSLQHKPQVQEGTHNADHGRSLMGAPGHSEFQSALETSDKLNIHENRGSRNGNVATYTQNQLLRGTTDLARPSHGKIQASYSTTDIPNLGKALDLTETSRLEGQPKYLRNFSQNSFAPPSRTKSNRHAREYPQGIDFLRDIPPFDSGQYAAHMSPLARPNVDSNSTSNHIMATTPESHYLPPPFHQFNTAPVMSKNQMYTPDYNDIRTSIPMTSFGADHLTQGSYQQQYMFHPILESSQHHPRGPTFQGYGPHHKRAQTTDDHARYANTKLEDLRGEILSLCKDQHGCRFLQKQLEENNPENFLLIFHETHLHIVELMVDPFGNYLCQKLLEYSNNEQRTALVIETAPNIMKIALNSHGTRALQKMIELLVTEEQIRIVTTALNHCLVKLVQDLNGNHVVQKCLNRLTSKDAQFIYDSMGTNCVIVGTHRHGCCVLQRCIDHASGSQKAQLIGRITDHAFPLVQDPFGNYVLQYIVDLQESCFSTPLCRKFQGHVLHLSKQKFSSNVIEKCLRGADMEVTSLLIEEMLEPIVLERMLKDSFANYVVQTAMDFSNPNIKARLVDAVRPILPSVRHTPHGRRIQNKIIALDTQVRYRNNITDHNVAV